MDLAVRNVAVASTLLQVMHMLLPPAALFSAEMREYVENADVD
jgi:hypothetical protein